MSLLMKALKSVERGPGAARAPELSLEPMEAGAEPAPRPAQAAADLIRAHGEGGERRRLMVLLALLVLVVVGLAAYFYVAVYMPWLLLPRAPAAGAAPPPAAPGRAVAEGAPLAPLTSSGALSPGPAAGAVHVPLVPADKSPAPGVVAAAREQAEPLVRPAASAGPDELAAAHALLESGRLGEAKQAYERLRLSRPDHPDVLLGLAVIAQAENRTEDAARLYLRVLDVDARNPYAQAALAELLGRAEPAAAEARLRQMIAQHPAPHPYFVLGNLLAAQGRWSEAQRAYFEAQRLDPAVADYAFNLAISLEHLNEPRAAADYYRRALRLAQDDPAAAHFDPAQALARLRHLSSP